MTGIDRLGWAAGFPFQAYGRTIGIRVNTPEILDRVIPLLPYGWKPSSVAEVERLYSLLIGADGVSAHSSPTGAPRRFHILYADWTRAARTLELDLALETLERDLRTFVAEWARRRVFIHAGVVGRRGRAIVIPGRSFTGKTTLVGELVRAGAEYYSDEYAVLDAQGRVYPFHKPLSVRSIDGDGHAGRQTNQSVEQFGGMIGHQPLPVGMVVLTSYRAGAHWRPKRVTSPGESVLALLANAVAARRAPEAVMRAAEQALRRATVLSGVRGEAEDVAQAILRRLDRED